MIEIIFHDHGYYCIRVSKVIVVLEMTVEDVINIIVVSVACRFRTVVQTEFVCGRRLFEAIIMRNAAKAEEEKKRRREKRRKGRRRRRNQWFYGDL